jgi:hypothetical protein
MTHMPYIYVRQRNNLFILTVFCLVLSAAFGDQVPTAPKSQQPIEIKLQKGGPAGVKIHHLSCYKDKASRLFIVSFKTDQPIQADVKIFKIVRGPKKPLLLAYSSEKKDKLAPNMDHNLVLKETGPESLATDKSYMLEVYEDKQEVRK